MLYTLSSSVVAAFGTELLIATCFSFAGTTHSTKQFSKGGNYAAHFFYESLNCKPFMFNYVVFHKLWSTSRNCFSKAVSFGFLCAHICCFSVDVRHCITQVILNWYSESEHTRLYIYV